ncbi:hypothetical protein HanRHA438_Chr08g0355001 [Helianthus annuus]|nr:hypothetical protein HanRHA438_Chr08g0355001 [Helianthus annuus]
MRGYGRNSTSFGSFQGGRRGCRPALPAGRPLLPCGCTPLLNFGDYGVAVEKIRKVRVWFGRKTLNVEIRFF